jgi:predicted phosphoribosyltransferase
VERSARARRESGQNPPHSCALDAADDGPRMLDDIGEILHITRERVRQLESKALRELQHRVRHFKRRLGMEDE